MSCKTVIELVDTSMKSAHEPRGLVTGFAPEQKLPSVVDVHKIPFCQTAETRRSSPVWISWAVPFWMAFGGAVVEVIGGSASAKVTLPASGVPVMVMTPSAGQFQ